MKVFVYGTLKPGELFFESFCQSQVMAWREAKTRGQVFHLPLGYPALVVDGEQELQPLTETHRWVEGALLEFGETDAIAVLAALDAFEDYEAGRSPTANQYERQWRAVFAPTGEALGSAWMYVMRCDRVRQLQGVLIPSGVWSHRDWPSIAPPPEGSVAISAESYGQNFLR